MLLVFLQRGRRIRKVQSIESAFNLGGRARAEWSLVYDDVQEKKKILKNQVKRDENRVKGELMFQSLSGGDGQQLLEAELSRVFYVGPCGLSRG